MKFEVVEYATAFKRAKLQLLEGFNIDGFEIPAGFVTDGASIPAPLWPVLPPFGRYLRAAVLHDYMLSLGMLREDADKHFYDQMRLDGVGEWRSLLIFKAVRAYSVLRGLK